MAKLSTVISTENQSSPTPDPEINLADMSNTSGITTIDTENESDSQMHDDDDDFLLDEEQGPERKAPPPDITKNPLANTVAIAVVTFAVLGGGSLIFWGLGAAKSGMEEIPDEPIAEVIEDAKQAEIERLQQELYEQRANVALQSLESTAGDGDEDSQAVQIEEQTARTEEGEAETADSSLEPVQTPPPPQQTTPHPVSNTSSSTPSSSGSSGSSAAPEPVYDDPAIWNELAQLGTATATVDPEVIQQQPSTTVVEVSDSSDIEMTTGIAPTAPPSPWDMAQIPVITINPTDTLTSQVSPGELGILHQEPTINLGQANAPGILVSAKGTDVPVPVPVPVEDIHSEPTPLLSTDNTLTATQYDTATVAIGAITEAEVVTPIFWDQESPRPTDGIFAVKLTEPMLGIQGEVVLPTGTQLIANVSHVTSLGHVFQTVVAIVWPDGTQFPIPVSATEEESNAPITPLVIRGKEGEVLIADAVERRDGGNGLMNDIMVATLSGIADATENTLEPDTSVSVNTNSGGSTVETQENTRDPQAAFARGFFEAATDRITENLGEEPEEIQIFQVEAGEKVSVVVNGVIQFSIPRRGWPNESTH